MHAFLAPKHARHQHDVLNMLTSFSDGSQRAATEVKQYFFGLLFVPGVLETRRFLGYVGRTRHGPGEQSHLFLPLFDLLPVSANTLMTAVLC